MFSTKRPVILELVAIFLSCLFAHAKGLYLIDENQNLFSLQNHKHLTHAGGGLLSAGIYYMLIPIWGISDF